MVDDDGEPRLDCRATQAADGCPWQTASREHGTPVYGMLGLDCWYRGKQGNWMLEELREAGFTPPGDFYGEGQEHDQMDVPALPPEYCAELGRWMTDHAEAYSEICGRNPEIKTTEQFKGAIELYRYAAWWLTWIAEAGEGSNVWY